MSVRPAFSGREPEDVRAHSLVRPAILVLLREQESHGYELVSRLAELGVEVTTMGQLYRLLRTMANEGLVSSYWGAADRGPAPRVYAITEVGEQHLEQSMPSVERLLRTVWEVVNRYGHGG